MQLIDFVNKIALKPINFEIYYSNIKLRDFYNR